MFWFLNQQTLYEKNTIGYYEVDDGDVFIIPPFYNGG